MNEIIEYEEQQRGDEPEYRPLERPQSLVSLGTLQANTPVALIEGAAGIADKLAEIIRKNKLATNIQGKEYVRVEGWTTLAALLGVIAREDGVETLEDGSYLATVSLVRMTDGQVISTASAECGMDETRWAKMPRYARRSMAITRATGKAARLAFSWIMALAGFQATPAEEMDFTAPPPPATDDHLDLWIDATLKAREGTDALHDWWGALSKQKKATLAKDGARWEKAKSLAADADAAREAA